ncbi:hypothetical protein [Clostridium baratii]|uniref:hypothetical protein n=1 Tax=Clostridium baratii TaxID=1561 RepID=UPI0030CBF556
MEGIKKILKIYLMLIILGLVLFKISKSYIVTTAVDTVLFIYLIMYFNLNKKEKSIITIFIAFIMVLLALDIENYFGVYQKLSYVENYSIYPEIVLDILSLVNLPFCGSFYILYKNNMLNLKFYIIPIYILIIINIPVIINMFKFNLHKNKNRNSN